MTAKHLVFSWIFYIIGTFILMSLPRIFFEDLKKQTRKSEKIIISVFFCIMFPLFLYLSYTIASMLTQSTVAYSLSH